MKTPTLKEKVAQYEAFLHKINLCVMCGNHNGVTELVSNADSWSYAHRVGNGELSDKQQQQLINKAFYTLLDTPKSDKIRSDMQKKYTTLQKEKLFFK